MTKCRFCWDSGWQKGRICGWCRGALRRAPVDPPKPCRCSHNDHQHTAGNGPDIPGGCCTACSCSFFEPWNPGEKEIA